jgi:hypothetical protein
MNIGSGSEAWPNDHQYNLEPFTLTNEQQRYYRTFLFLLYIFPSVFCQFPLCGIALQILKFLKVFVFIYYLKNAFLSHFFSPSLLVFQSLSFFCSNVHVHPTVISLNGMLFKNSAAAQRWILKIVGTKKWMWSHKLSFHRKSKII